MVFKQVTPSQIRDAEKNLQLMESMIEAMTPGNLPLFLLPRLHIVYILSSNILLLLNHKEENRASWLIYVSSNNVKWPDY